MIKELVQFTSLLSDDFKALGTKPKVGIHILLNIEKNNEGEVYVDVENFEFERFTKKTKMVSDFLEKCKTLHLNAWCIDTNKCYDLPTKAIHTCSPYCIAFKREHLVGGIKFNKNADGNKKQIYERFGAYFEKAFLLLDCEEEKLRLDVFRHFFTHNKEGNFQEVINKIVQVYQDKKMFLSEKMEALKEQFKNSDDKELKKTIKTKIDHLNLQLNEAADIDDGDYFIFYLEESVETYKAAHQKYLSANLFNSDKYNTKPNEENRVYGTNNFLNGFNVNKPFLMHKTASFDISSRISDLDALKLYEFQNVLRLGTLPNPLPIFIYNEELNSKVIGLFRKSEIKLRYGEIIKELFESYSKDLENYYLLYTQNTKDGLIFKDFDFVSKFQYQLKNNVTGESFWSIQPFFNNSAIDKIFTIFDFQNKVIQQIFNNNLIVKTKDGKVIIKYFDEIKQEYCKSAPNYLNILKYRMACYNFIYKSQRKAITPKMFDNMMQAGILEDIRLDKQHKEQNNIHTKLNIWFSLREAFDLTNTYKIEETMASKLKEYRQFMKKLAADEFENTDSIEIQKFAYAAGQVIYYILNKSKTEDKSYKRLEPYLQQVSCDGLKMAISRDFARYKHENFSQRFEHAASFVLSFETNENMKNYLPEILSGIFSNNELYSDKGKENETSINN